jgi:uncharacterized protein
MKENLILIFTRNPELGKVKTRLAATIGDFNALEIYKILLKHTVKVVNEIQVSKRVLYSEIINHVDIWDPIEYQKKMQFGNDLGEKMENAFADGFAEGYKKIIIIGTDLYDLEESDFENAFENLKNHDVVIGPADDGGYYLLGLKSIPNGIFTNKKWGSNSVLSDTLSDIEDLDVFLLESKNDIDTFDDIIKISEFQKYTI